MPSIQTQPLKPFIWVRDSLKPHTDALKTPERLTLLLVVLNLCLTIPLAAILNIWFDEAYTLDTTSRGVGYAIHQAIYFEEQAPLYFVILSIWRSLNDSIFFARGFSILCIGGAIWLASLVSKALFKELHPGWAVAAIAFNPFIIWAAVEARLFAFSILLSALLLLLFIEGYLNEPPQFKVRALHMLTAIVALYTHYFLAFSIAAYGIALLCLRKKQEFLSYCLSMLVVSASFIPMLLLVVQSKSKWSDNTIATGISSPIIESFKTSFAANLLYLLPAEIGEESPLSWRLLRLVLLASLLAIAFFFRRSIRTRQCSVWLISLSISTLFFAAFLFFTLIGLNDSIQHYRHTISLLVPALFSVIAVFSLMQPDRLRKTALRVWLGLMLVLSVTSLSLTYAPLAKQGDYIRVASYLMKHETANQPILVFNPEVEMALSHYYKGINALIALPRKEEFKAYDINALLINNQQDILSALPQNQHNRHIWLVTDTRSIRHQTAYQRSYEILDEFVSQRYAVEINQEFHGSNVRRLSQRRFN